MNTTSRIFVIAGLVNIIGILTVSKGFTNHYLTELDPGALSWLGLVTIMLWGAAYIAVAKNYSQVPNIVAVFVMEKFLYFGSWVAWMVNPPAPLGEIIDKSVLTGAFLGTYGPIDLAFGLFFARVYFQVRKK